MGEEGRILKQSWQPCLLGKCCVQRPCPWLGPHVVAEAPCTVCSPEHWEVRGVLEQPLSVHRAFPSSLARMLLCRACKGAAPPAAQHILLALGREKEGVLVRISQCLKTLDVWLFGRRRGQTNKSPKATHHEVDPRGFVCEGIIYFTVHHK